MITSKNGQMPSLQKASNRWTLLHLATAEEAHADYFCTCDDRFLKKAKALEDMTIQVVSPLALIEELEQ
jgi:hypothetical protein